MASYNEEATKRLIGMIGEVVTPDPETQESFFKKLQSVLDAGANPGVKLPGLLDHYGLSIEHKNPQDPRIQISGNPADHDSYVWKVLPGETPVEYYRRREKLYLDRVEVEKRSSDGIGEQVPAQYVAIARRAIAMLEEALHRNGA